MRFASFTHAAGAGYGVTDGQRVHDCAAVLGNRYPDLKAAIAADALEAVAKAAAAAPRYALDEVTLLPVIPNPGKILCVGLNYQMHRQETGRGADFKYPTIFTRFADSQTGHGTALVLPAASAKFDYEGELAVIIGRAGRAIGPEAALEHVAGYACYNDGSVRDFQHHTPQFTPGKNFPASGGFGPWMVTADAFGVPGPQAIRTRLNGEVVQDALLSDMIFDVAEIIAYCSRFTELRPGDVIATGTPGGVGAKRTPPLWLKAGDTVEVEIEGIGTLRNGVAAESA